MKNIKIQNSNKLLEEDTFLFLVFDPCHNLVKTNVKCFKRSQLTVKGTFSSIQILKKQHYNIWYTGFNQI